MNLRSTDLLRLAALPIVLAWATGIRAGDWVADFDLDHPEVVSVQGDQLHGMNIGPTIQIMGSGDAAQLMIRMTLSGTPEPGSYAPTLLSVDFEGSEYSCVGGMETRVTLDDVAPMRGGVSGPVTCSPKSIERNADTTFRTRVEGRFDAGN